MQLRDHYLNDPVGNSCFITGRYEVAEGERIIDLDLDLETKPAYGRVCLSELAVKLLNQQLGWNVEPEAKLTDLRRENKQLREHNAQLLASLERVTLALAPEGAS